MLNSHNELTNNVWKLVSKLDEDVLALLLTVIRRTDLISNVNLFC